MFMKKKKVRNSTNQYWESMEHAAFPWDLCVFVLVVIFLSKSHVLIDVCHVFTGCRIYYVLSHYFLKLADAFHWFYYYLANISQNCEVIEGDLIKWGLNLRLFLKMANRWRFSAGFWLSLSWLHLAISMWDKCSQPLLLVLRLIQH